MHSSNTPSGRRFHYNTDFSGAVDIVLDESEVTHDEFNGKPFVVASIPMEDILAIVAAAGWDLNLDQEVRP